MSAEAPVSVTSPVKVVSPASSIVSTVFVVLPPEPSLFGSPKVIVPLKLLVPFSVSFIKPMASGEPECPKPKFNIAVFAVLESCVEASIKRVEEVPPDTVAPVEVVSSLLELLKYNLLAPSLLKTANNSDKSLFPKPIVVPLLLNQRFPVPASSI